ncbi:MAG: hypothetical protein ACKVT2_10375 [Saprospiraceae bacterium]
MTHIPSVVTSAFLEQKVTSNIPITLPTKNTVPNKVLHCEVVFGAPSMDCGSTGICKITGTNSVRLHLLKKSCQITFGQIAAAPGGKISLFFFRKFLCTNLYRKHFIKGIFCIKESCPLPSEIVNDLNIIGKELLPGNYTVLECDGYFRVDVDCH